MITYRCLACLCFCNFCHTHAQTRTHTLFFLSEELTGEVERLRTEAAALKTENVRLNALLEAERAERTKLKAVFRTAVESMRAAAEAGSGAGAAGGADQRLKAAYEADVRRLDEEVAHLRSALERQVALYGDQVRACACVVCMRACVRACVCVCVFVRVRCLCGTREAVSASGGLVLVVAALWL